MGNYRVEAQKNQKGNSGHASTFPFFEANSAIGIVVDFHHHFLQNLKNFDNWDLPQNEREN